MSNIRMPIGCSFDVEDLFYKYKFEKIKVPLNIRKKYDPNNTLYSRFAGKVFRTMIKIIITDIIETGAVFKLPLAGNPKAYIKVDRLNNSDFKNLRKVGYWKDLNFFESMFTGPMLTLYIYRYGTEKKRIIMCDKKLTKRMIDKCNEGFLYGDTCLDKTVKDYYDIVFKTFPELPLDVVKSILIYGWRMLYAYINAGAEVNCAIKGFLCYFGRIYKNRLKQLEHYSRVLSKRLRLWAIMNKFPKTDYYYFALDRFLYQKFLKTKTISFPIRIYRFFEECSVINHDKEYIFRTKIPGLNAYSRIFRNGITDLVELILTRNKLKFKDICTSENNYMILEYRLENKRHTRINYAKE